jgi:acyl-CoA synthetase (AMP-forming)/AMP-acid ligase II
VVRIVDGPITSLDRAEPLPPGEIGELIVAGPVVTREYIEKKGSGVFFPNAPAEKRLPTPFSANRLAKIPDGGRTWHRMGDSGYLDEQDRFWFCGRVAHRVLTADGPMYPVCCEAIFNRHPDVFRSALVGIGEPGRQRPVVVAEPLPERFPQTTLAHDQLVAELEDSARSHPLTESIRTFLVKRSFPVDVRHNAKISRERLAVWAARRLGGVSTR